MNTTFYGVLGKNGLYRDIYKNPLLVEWAGNEKEEIVKLEVRPINEGESSPYWGWHDYERNEYCMIWRSIHAARCCFPYGPEIEEKLGKGKFTNFVITAV